MKNGTGCYGSTAGGYSTWTKPKFLKQVSENMTTILKTKKKKKKKEKEKVFQMKGTIIQVLVIN